MAQTDSRSEMPRPVSRRSRPEGLLAGVLSVWRARGIIRALTERELRVRYKQAVLGISWALVTPVALMIVFSVFVTRVADIDTGGVPYPLFAYLGLVPWAFFATALSQGGNSLVTNAPIIRKVPVPREVFPVSSVVVAGFDSAVALIALGVLFVIYRFVPMATVIWTPVLFSIQVLFTVGVTLLFSSIIVYLRDLRHALPIVLQLGLFATPIAYGIDVVPEQFRTVYSFLNPLAPVIDGYRRTVLFGLPPDWGIVVPGALGALLVFFGGYLVFRRLELGFADVA